MAVITNIRKNIMGTTDFDGRFPGMAKPQDFIVYPVKDASTQITIQSDNRFGFINMETGDVQIAKGTGTYANSATFMLAKMRGTVVKDKLTPEQLAELRQHIGRTAGAEVGSAGVYSDNTGALGIGGLRGPGAPAAESRVRAFVNRLLENDESAEDDMEGQAPKRHMTQQQKHEVKQFAEELWGSLEGGDLEKAEELTEGDIPLDDRWPKHFTPEQRKFGHRLVWAWYERITGRS